MVDYPALKIVLALISLTVLVFFVQRFVAGPFIRIFIGLLLISILGAVIYSLIIEKKEGPLPGSFERAVEPYLPSPAPINRAKEQVKKLEDSQKKKGR
ncbi:MAG: FeoB-associated Cys-rich membrane protein [Nitrospirota bacterium]